MVLSALDPGQIMAEDFDRHPLLTRSRLPKVGILLPQTLALLDGALKLGLENSIVFHPI